MQHHNTPRQIPLDCTKINVDESHFGHVGRLACGGLARNSNKNFIKGFYNKMGFCNGF